MLDERIFSLVLYRGILESKSDIKTEPEAFTRYCLGLVYTVFMRVPPKIRQDWLQLLLLLSACCFIVLGVLLEFTPELKTSTVSYTYTDVSGATHTARHFVSVPERYRTAVVAVETAHVSLVTLFRLVVRMFGPLLFWLGVLILAGLYGTGKLDEWYLLWIDFQKEQRGHKGLFRKRHSQTHETFLELLFGLAGKFCLVDGVVQQAEIDTLEELIVHRLQLSEADSIQARRFFRRGRDADKSVESYLNQFKKIFGNRKQLLELAYSFLESVAEASGEMTAEEERLLQVAREILGVSGRKTSGARSSSDLSLTEAYAALECTPHESFSTIKRRYRKKVLELHPDRLHAQGMSAEFVKLAHERFLEVQEAFEKIEEIRG